MLRICNEIKEIMEHGAISTRRYERRNEKYIEMSELKISE